MAEGKSRKKQVAQWVETTVRQSGRQIRIPSPIDLEDSESELNSVPSAVGKRKATATKSSSRKVHGPGTGGLPQKSDSDSEEEEEDNDKEEAMQESLLHEDGVLEEESDRESEDDFDEGGDGGFPGNVFKKSKKKVPKSPMSTVPTNSCKRGDWELVQRFVYTSSRKKAMKKVEQCFAAQMCLAGARDMETS